MSATQDKEVIDMTPSNYVKAEHTESDLRRLYNIKRGVDVVYSFYEWVAHDHRRSVVHKDFVEALKGYMNDVASILGPTKPSCLIDLFMFSVLRGIRDGLKDQEKRFPFDLETVEREVVDPEKIISALQAHSIEEQAMWCGMWKNACTELPDYQQTAMDTMRTEGLVPGCDDALVLVDDIELIASAMPREDWECAPEHERGLIVFKAIGNMYVFEML